MNIHPLTALKVMQDAPVIPVIVLNDAQRAVHLAKALIAGGINMLEVTLRTPNALSCIEAIAKQVPEAIVGAGTLKSANDAQSAHNAGARFAVSPGFTNALAQACLDLKMPLLPGVATGSEIMQALEAGFTELKFFPALQAGGSAMLKAWSSPFAEVTFCPTGGIHLGNAPEFLALPNVACVGGSWLTPADLIDKNDWNAITQLAKTASQLHRKTTKNND